MIKSMTAYGRGEVETAAQKWVVELKSVNHRFLELALNLPRRFWALEDRFRKLIKSRVARGRVDMQLSWESFEEKSVTLRLDMGLVAGVRDVLERLRLAGNTPESLKLEHFLHFSDLLVAKEQANQDLELEAAWETVSQAVNQALDLLDEMRTTEGAALAADLAGSLADIRREMSRIVVLAPRLPELWRERVVNRLAELFPEGSPVDETRLAQEVALMAERRDVAEELARLARGRWGASRNSCSRKCCGRPTPSAPKAATWASPRRCWKSRAPWSASGSKCKISSRTKGENQPWTGA
jgi:uncharacterized protein (TIGR00255 family)